MVRAHSPSRPAAHRPVAAAAGAVCAPLPVVPVLLALAAALATLLASPRTASSQRLFGQNKIQYEDFQWRVMKTPHVDLHFYPQEQQVACWVAEVAEEAVVEFGDAMQLELRKPIPFMLYSSPQAFQQTNVSPQMISESVAGLTELIKGRVLVPHNGSYHLLRWVVRHELVHAVMLQKLTRVMHEHKKTRYTYPPLWFVEGLAEWLAAEWDSRADMVMRDAVINEKLVPIQELWRIAGTFQMYKEGQSILSFIEQQYGRDKVLQFLEDWWQANTFDQHVVAILGVTVEELNDAWTEQLKRHYFPQVKDRDSINMRGVRLAERGRLNLKPCPLPTPAAAGSAPAVPPASGGGAALADAPLAAGYDFVYMSSYEDFANIRLSHRTPGSDARDAAKPALLVKGGTTHTFESLHFLQTALDINQRRELVLVSKQGERDVLHIFDVDRRRVVGTLELEGLVGLGSPGWSPDGESIVFAGVDRSGQRDIYRVQRSGSGLQRLTADIFDDLDPDWSPDGSRIVFASDRCDSGKRGSYNLYLIDVESGALRPLTRGPHQDRAPAWSPDGRLIAFGSNRDRQILDLYVTDLAGTVQPVVRCQTATMDPEWSLDGQALLCTSFVDAGFGIFEVPLDRGSLPAGEGPPQLLAATALGPGLAGGPPPGSAERGWRPDTPDTSYVIDAYRRRFGLDMVSGGVVYDPEFGGGGGGGQISLSDLLGNERLYFFIANDGGGGGGGRGFLDSFDLGFTYFNQARRLNWALGAFRLTRTYNADLDIYRRETRVGGLLMAQYPLSRFNRVETSLVMRKVTDHLYRSFEEANTFFVTNLFTYVHDSTLWTIRGPFNGSRYNVSLGLTTDIGKGLGDYSSVLFDFRHYERLRPRIVHALRVIGRFSFGDEGQLYYVGGPFTLRGYPRRWLLGQKLLLINNEVRIPFIERLVLNLPMGLVEMPTFHSAAFLDLAWARDRDDPAQRRGSAGFGIYMGGGPYPRLRVDFAYVTDFVHIASKPSTEFSVGFNY